MNVFGGFTRVVAVGGNVVIGGELSDSDDDQVVTRSKHSINLGKKEVQGPVKAGFSATLNGTTVLGNSDIRAEHSVTLNGVTAGDVSAGHSATISSSKIGNVRSEHSCELMETCAANVNAGHSLEAEDCPSLAHVTSNHGMKINSCPQIASVEAGHSLKMKNCVVAGDATAEHNARVKKCKIGGALKFSCGSDEGAKLEQVTCPKVVITYRENLVIRNSVVMNIGMIGNRISGVGNQKTITLPEQYANYGSRQMITSQYCYSHQGRTVTYSGNTNQIIIKGERLSDLIKKYGALGAEAKEPEKELPEIVLTLVGICKIDEVVFNGAKGRVVLADGGEFKGTITLN